jgi:hypothetical protein
MECAPLWKVQGEIADFQAASLAHAPFARIAAGDPAGSTIRLCSMDGPAAAGLSIPWRM